MYAANWLTNSHVDSRAGGALDTIHKLFDLQVKEISDSGNPYKNKQLPVCGHLTRTGGFQQTKAFQAHKYSVNR